MSETHLNQMTNEVDGLVELLASDTPKYNTPEWQRVYNLLSTAISREFELKYRCNRTNAFPEEMLAIW